MEYLNITFIGAGNMARAIVLGIIEAGYPANKITLTDHSDDKLAHFKKLGARVTQDNYKAVEHADVVLFAVKPNHIKTACKEIKEGLQEKTLIISIAAGVPTTFIEDCLGGERPVARAMPNTASSVSAGVTGIFVNKHVVAAQELFIENLLETIGMLIFVDDESQIPIITATSGSGIAYYFRFMEIMAQEVVKQGLPEEVAKFMVAQTALGAAKLSLESEDDFTTLIKHVSSPNGTTQAALDSMNAANIQTVLIDAMHAAKKRSQELTEDLCNS